MNARARLSAADVIRILGLVPLPGEGGYYRETHRSHMILPLVSLPGPFTGPRSAATAIYYFLTPETCSILHRLPSDEVYHFYLGDPVEMLQLRTDGEGERIILGPDIKGGMRPQVAVPAGTWQGSRLIAGGRFALMGTTMAPGFEKPDFETGSRAALIADYPDFAKMITALTGE